MNRPTSIAWVLLTCAAALAEQEAPPEPKAPAPATAPDAAPAAEEPPAAPVRGVRYRVMLRSGREFQGVVQAASVFERRSVESGWVDCDKDETGSGMRLWYVRGQDGYIFLPSRHIRNALKVGDLTESEGRDLAQVRGASARRAAEERTRLRQERRAREEAERAAKEAVEEAEKTATPGAPKGSGELTAEDKLARYTALLAKFPPGKWTPDTPKEIERRKIVLDVFPSDEEKEFLAVFEEWQRAYQTWKAGQEKPAETPASKPGEAKAPK